MNPMFCFSYWKLLLMSRFTQHALTMIRISDPDYDQRLLSDWMEDCELLNTPTEAHYAVRRVADLLLSSPVENLEVLKLTFEEYSILLQSFKIAELILEDLPFAEDNCSDQSYRDSFVYNAQNRIKLLSAEVLSLSESVKMLALKISDYTNDFPDATNQEEG